MSSKQNQVSSSSPKGKEMVVAADSGGGLATKEFPVVKTESNEQITESNPSQKTTEKKEKEKEKEKEEKEKEKERNEELVRYLPLRAAARMGDWETAKRIIDSDNNALTAKITSGGDTILHIATKSRNAVQFVSELLKIMDARLLEKTDNSGFTALTCAAIVGNTKVAKILVEKNPILPQIASSKNRKPLYAAASYGRKDMFLYLLSVTKDEDPSPFRGEKGVELMMQLTNSSLNGIALNLLKQYPSLAEEKRVQIHILQALSKRPFDFQSGTRLGLLERLIYHCIPVEEKNFPTYSTKLGGDLENPMDYPKPGLNFLHRISSTFGKFMYQKTHIMLWSTIKRIVPSIIDIHDIKLKHVQALELVKIMCTAVGWSQYDTVLKAPLYDALRFGIHEFVKEIIETYPVLAEHSENQHTLLQVAVLNRQDKIFNFICHMGLHKRSGSNYIIGGNNILHLAGKLKPSSQVSGAALQMQRELQWFKCVENFVPQEMKQRRNKDGKIAKEVFTENHKQLVKEGEDWTKRIASSCTIVASLIVTMVFSAAFTVPGGSNDQGTPIFLFETSFITFWIADALALFSSSTSVMMFLILLISRYSEEDFLKSVPNKLIIGLLTLFFSIASMMIAFGATLHIVFVTRWSRVVIPIALLACLPVTLFGWYMFPLLAELIVSTYGKSILQSKEKM